MSQSSNLLVKHWKIYTKQKTQHLVTAGVICIALISLVFVENGYMRACVGRVTKKQSKTSLCDWKKRSFAGKIS